MHSSPCRPSQAARARVRQFVVRNESTVEVLSKEIMSIKTVLFFFLLGCNGFILNHEERKGSTCLCECSSMRRGKAR